MLYYATRTANVSRWASFVDLFPFILLTLSLSYLQCIWRFFSLYDTVTTCSCCLQFCLLKYKCVNLVNFIPGTSPIPPLLSPQVPPFSLTLPLSCWGSFSRPVLGLAVHTLYVTAAHPTEHTWCCATHFVNVVEHSKGYWGYWLTHFGVSNLTLRGRAREELVSKTSQFKWSPGSPVTDLWL